MDNYYLKEEDMPICDCKQNKIGKAIFYCNQEPKCMGRIYYCLLCMDEHNHKNIMSS